MSPHQLFHRDGQQSQKDSKIKTKNFYYFLLLKEELPVTGEVRAV